MSLVPWCPDGQIVPPDATSDEHGEVYSLLDEVMQGSMAPLQDADNYSVVGTADDESDHASPEFVDSEGPRTCRRLSRNKSRPICRAFGHADCCCPPQFGGAREQAWIACYSKKVWQEARIA